MVQPSSYTLLCWLAVLVAPSPAHSTAPYAQLPPITRDIRAFWSFQEPQGSPKVDKINGYILKDYNTSDPAPSVTDSPGLFGPHSVSLHSHRLEAKRATVPAVANITGPKASVTLVAWIKLGDQHGGGFVGGVWNEANAWRQFGIFLDGTAGCPTPNGTVAHISGAGAPESGHRYCQSAACGTTDLGDRRWHCVANVYNSSHIMAYVDGKLDNTGHKLPSRNPLKYPDPPNFPVGGIFTPPEGKGADLAMGFNLIHAGGGVGPAVHGNVYHGNIGGFAVYGTALSPAEMKLLCS